MVGICIFYIHISLKQVFKCLWKIYNFLVFRPFWAVSGISFFILKLQQQIAILPMLVDVSSSTYIGDQIGRIFAHWAIVYFGQVFENYRSTQMFVSTNFDKKWLGIHFGRFCLKLIWSSPCFHAWLSKHCFSTFIHRLWSMLWSLHFGKQCLPIFLFLLFWV
jgi:hypothetical protein